MPQRSSKHLLRAACVFWAAALLAAWISAAAFALPTLSTDPAAPDGTNGWFRTLPTVTVEPPLGGSNTLYQWQPGGPVTVYTAPLKLDASTYGQPILRYGYGVNPGVFDEWADYPFKIDPVAPLVTGITEKSGLAQFSWTRSTDATFLIQSFDVHSLVQGFSYVFDQTQPAVDDVADTTAASVDVHNLYTGKWYLQIKALDNAGNWGPVVVRQHWVDVTPPVVFSDAVPEYEGTATVNVSITDQHSGPGQALSRLDGDPYDSASQQSTTAAGAHTIWFKAEDAVGNTSSESSATFTVVANQTPTTTIAGVINDWRASQKFTLSAVDNSSGVAHTYYRVDSGPNMEYISEVTLSDNGVHSVEYWSVDNAGNVEQPKSVTARVDNSGPSLLVSNGPFLEGSSTLNYMAVDAGSGVSGPCEVLVGGVRWLSGSPVVLTAPGVTIVSITASDNVGNVTTSDYSVTVMPQLAPVTSISGLAGKWVPSQTFSLLSVDDASGISSIRYSLNGLPAVEYFNPVTITDEGVTAITYRAVDGLGNVEALKGPAYAYVDHTAPVSLARAWVPRPGSTSVTLSSFDRHAGVARIWYRLDGGSVETYTVPPTTSVKGFHVFEFGAVDFAGNVEATKTLVFSVATVPTRLSLKVTSGRMALVAGALTSANGVLANSNNVYVWTSRYGGTWTKVGRASYDPATRTYRAWCSYAVNQRFQLRFNGDADHIPSSSPVVTAAILSAPVTPWLNAFGRYIVVYGRLSPTHPAGTKIATLYCYRLESNRWVLRKTADAKAYAWTGGSKYGALVRLPARGRWRIVAVHADAAHGRMSSSPRILLVR
jgi:hypothetical protein